MLARLGFAKVGVHRSKAVNRWRQGDINIVVNADKDGFAHSYYVTHGPSVCALALRVDDAAASVARALALLDQPFRQAVGPGELDIPAVRGLGGSLIYFVDAASGLDRLWEVDFVACEAPAASEAGLAQVDHLTQAMPYEEMLSWLLFYTSLFELRKTPIQNVIDPGGVVQSQVVETGDDALRLVLNASQSRHTLAARFQTDLFGSGVPNIALASRDIFATVARLRANGVKLLPIPENYYDDLDARFDLGADAIERLRAHDVLYDRDESGEFFHAYTRGLLEGGFCFELVERRRYAGFGAVNAPIRLAAQARLAAPSPG
jgi:4-hydroxyphenylpyruvate dioxygenase